MPDPTEAQIRSRMEFALAAAQEAGRLTLEWFRRGGFPVECKPDGTPVTAADRAAEELLRRRIGEAFSSDGVLGEEFGETEGQSGYRWILDPIDGTKSFCHGVPLYGTLVAVEDLREKRAVAGVIVMPALDEVVYAGRGLGAWHVLGDGPARQARVSRIGSLRQALVCTTSMDYFDETATGEVMRAVVRACGASRGWSDCYGHVLVATGRAELVVEPKISIWDVAPMQAILLEAGGAYTDWDGQPSIYSPRGLSTNGLVLQEVLTVLRSRGPSDTRPD